MKIKVESSWDGYKWIVREGMHFDDFPLQKDQFELRVLQVLKLLARDNEIYADVGSHTGYHVIRVAKHYKRAYAFEPEPETYQILKFNIVLNNIDNVRAYNLALGERSTRMKLFRYGGQSSFCSIEKFYDVVDVEVRRFDDLLDEIGCVDVFKIDVEGYEYNVILGMEETIKKCKPIIIIEHHDLRPPYISSFNKIQMIMKKRYGYHDQFITGSHVLYHPNDCSKLKHLVWEWWLRHVVENLLEGRDWYIGIPYNWWWGLDMYSFIYALPNHICRENEPEWFERFKKFYPKWYLQYVNDREDILKIRDKIFRTGKHQYKEV